MPGLQTTKKINSYNLYLQPQCFSMRIIFSMLIPPNNDIAVSLLKIVAHYFH